MPTVFITNTQDGHSYAAASAYGAVRPVTSGNYPIFETARLRDEIMDALLYAEADDYLLLSGSSLICALCLNIWLMRLNQCKVLMWDRGKRNYSSRTIVKAEYEVAMEQARDRKAYTNVK